MYSGTRNCIFSSHAEDKINHSEVNQQFQYCFLSFSANTSQGPEQTRARKKLKRDLFRAVSEGNPEELQRLLAELKERSSACTSATVPGKPCREEDCSSACRAELSHGEQLCAQLLAVDSQSPGCNVMRASVPISV